MRSFDSSRIGISPRERKRERERESKSLEKDRRSSWIFSDVRGDRRMRNGALKLNALAMGGKCPRVTDNGNTRKRDMDNSAD